MSEEKWLAQAIALALENVGHGGKPFGALVVLDGDVVATGVNQALQDNDPTAHAELLAIRAATRRLGRPDLHGALLVASGEPCPMCQAAALLAGVRRVIYAAGGQHASRAGLGTETIRAQLRLPFAERTATEFAHVDVEKAGEPFTAWSQRQGG